MAIVLRRCYKLQRSRQQISKPLRTGDPDRSSDMVFLLVETHRGTAGGGS